MAKGSAHMKRLSAPNHWMQDKLGGIFAPRPTAGPHSFKECVPLMLVLRNRLRYALTRREVFQVLSGKNVKVDGKVRTDAGFPSGFMDVISIEKTQEHFRILFDVKGRFVLVPISDEEATYKIVKVIRSQLGPKGIPFIATKDGRTIRYPLKGIKVNDSVKIDIATGKILAHIPLSHGNVCFISGGSNMGRVGKITKHEHHHGSFDILHLVDSAGTHFATRLSNACVIGSADAITLPKGNGIKAGILA